MYAIECPNCGGTINTTSLKNFSCNSCGNGSDSDSGEKSVSRSTVKNSLKELSYQELLKKLPSFYNFEKTINGGISVKIPVKQMLQPNIFLAFSTMGIFFTLGGLLTMMEAASDVSAGAAPVVLFGILFTLVGIAAIWVCLYVALDTVEIKAERGQLSRTLKPISVPSLEDITISSSNISQFYCKHTMTQGKHGSTHRYLLCMKCTNSQNGIEKEISLISADNPTPIWAMEIFIERTLEIEDEIVNEEHTQAVYN